MERSIIRSSKTIYPYGIRAFLAMRGELMRRGVLHLHGVVDPVHLPTAIGGGEHP